MCVCVRACVCMCVCEQVSEELEGVKAEMDEKGSNMMNAGPLVRIKQSLTRLKKECTEMEVRMGVVREEGGVV